MEMRSLWYWRCQSLIGKWHENGTKAAQYGTILFIILGRSVVYR